MIEEGSLHEKRRVHPSPQFMRDDYVLLDGDWEANGQTVRVPYPLESPRSGFQGAVPEQFTYTKIFEVPKTFTKERVLLHFGAVDQIAEVYVNGHFLGRHEGGYLSFSFDITDALNRDGENVLRVDVTDTLSHHFPYGKQRKDRGGMWYTPVSGIWKSVWLENVSSIYIRSVKLTPDLCGVAVQLDIAGLPKHPSSRPNIAVRLSAEGQVLQTFQFTKNTFYLSVENPRLWTPDRPFLYDVTFTIGGEEPRDVAVSYFALRTVTIEKVKHVNRVCLNGNPVFLNGVLDQGYFQNGIYTADGIEDYENDILSMKELGFNFLRKHIKVEPASFYYAADYLGMFVMQDMVNSGRYDYLFETIFPTLTFKKRPDNLFRHVDRSRKEFFIRHCKDTVREVYNHPSVIAYTIFNEGWGQFESDRLYEMMREWDKTRLIDSTSGWFAQHKSDFDSEHIYFHNERLQPYERPLLLSECGGYGYPIEGHLFKKKGHYGYGGVKSVTELTAKIKLMYRAMVFPSIADGMCGVIYTQLSDVEDEINGLYTYDREICKVEKAEMAELGKKVQEVLRISCR